MKVILQADGDLLAQARIARLAIDAGRPEGTPAFRIYGTVRENGPPHHHYSAVYNKCSITIYPHPEDTTDAE